MLPRGLQVLGNQLPWSWLVTIIWKCPPKMKIMVLQGQETLIHAEIVETAILVAFFFLLMLDYYWKETGGQATTESFLFKRSFQWRLNGSTSTTFAIGKKKDRNFIHIHLGFFVADGFVQLEAKLIMCNWECHWKLCENKINTLCKASNREDFCNPLVQVVHQNGVECRWEFDILLFIHTPHGCGWCQTL